MIAKRKKPSGHPENCSSGSPQTRAPLIASSLALRRQRRAAGAGSGERPGLWCPGDAGAPRPCRCPRAGRALSPAGGRPAPRQPSLRAAFPRDLRALPPAGSGRPAPASARRRSGMRAAAPGPDPLRAPAGEYGVGGVGVGEVPTGARRADSGVDGRTGPRAPSPSRRGFLPRPRVTSVLLQLRSRGGVPAGRAGLGGGARPLQQRPEPAGRLGSPRRARRGRSTRLWRPARPGRPLPPRRPLPRCPAAAPARRPLPAQGGPGPRRHPAAREPALGAGLISGSEPNAGRASRRPRRAAGTAAFCQPRGWGWPAAWPVVRPSRPYRLRLAFTAPGGSSSARYLLRKLLKKKILKVFLWRATFSVEAKLRTK